MPTTTSSSSRNRSSRMMPSLPAGFRFHPTDEELIVHYLMNQAAAVPCLVPIIAEVNIYQCNPWDLPPKALFGDKEWYFFSPRERKYPNGARPNRAAGSGYWKATGTDKAILSTTAGSVVVGVKKALVFYRGKPPRGVKTDWIMHEYRLTVTDGGSSSTKTANKRRGSSSSSSMRLDDWVLCRIHKKSNNFQLFSSSDDHQNQEEGSTVEEEEGDTALHNNNSSNTTMMMSNGRAPSPNPDDEHHFQFPAPLMSMTKSCSLTDLLSTIDYSTLSQLLLDAPPPEPTDHDIIHSTPAPCHPLNLNNDHNSSMSMNTPQQQGDALFLCSEDYGAAAGYNYNYNSDLKRKRIMSTTDGANSTTSSFDDDGNGSLKKKLVLHLPSDSSRSGYCNQQQLAEAAYSSATTSSSSVQYHPSLNQQLLLLNNHMGMQMQ